jgi:hypothetical protein
MNEGERQQRFVERLLADVADAQGLAVRERGARALRGLQAYRDNTDASAARALAAAFPTVRLLVGEHDFALLARDHWRAAPPQRGDLGAWGDAYADALRGDPRLADFPYLADCARLDWALFQCERAADATLDAASMTRLADTDPARLVFETMPGVALVHSPWPIAQIHAAHHAGASDFAAARAAIASRRGETVLVARSGWKARVHVLDAVTARWMQSLRDGADLARALDAAGPAFDFGAWLADAIGHGVLKGIRVLVD